MEDDRGERGPSGGGEGGGVWMPIERQVMHITCIVLNKVFGPMVSNQIGLSKF